MELYKLSKQQREGRDLQRSSAVKGVKSNDSTRFLQTQHLSTAKGKVLRNIQIDLAVAGSDAQDSSAKLKGTSRDGSDLMRRDKKELEENLLMMQQKQRRLADQKRKAAKMADQSATATDKLGLSDIKLTVHQPTKRAQATRNYRQQVGVGLFSHGNQAATRQLHPTLASAGSNKHHPNRTNLKSISDFHMKSLTASNASLKFKNKFSESRKRKNFMTLGGMDPRDSPERDDYRETSVNRRLSSNENKIYNTFSSNYVNTKRRLGTSGSQLSQRLNISKVGTQKKTQTAGKAVMRVP